MQKDSIVSREVGCKSMTKDETRKILMVVDAVYPSFKVENPESMVDAWYFFLQDYDAEEILLGLKTFISSQGSAYAPTVSELIAMTRKPKEFSKMGEAEAWAKVRKAISRGIYYFDEEFDKLPEEAKKVVVRPEQLKEWAVMPSDEIDTVVRSNFRRSYEAMQKRESEIDAMPKEVRELIGRSEQKMIATEG